MMAELKSIFVLSLMACAWSTVLSSSDIYTHDRKRPVPLLDANHGCFQRFEVSENTIIRAQDSRQVGAKFLNESDVGNREDCMALCCRTAHCTVAVFEEKNAGSCFLFDCGNSENFMCQFTTHAYYTSTRIRELPSMPITSLYLQQQQKQQEEESKQEIREKELEAQQQRKQEQEESIVWSRPKNLHEQELNNLRRTDFRSTSLLGQAGTRARASITTAGQVTTSKDITTVPPPVDSTKGRQCTRQQFECHSGECIAIYDTCNGIPQCEDGSDEGVELNCPSTQDPTQIRTNDDLASDLLASSAGHPRAGSPRSGMAEVGTAGSRAGSEQAAGADIGKMNEEKIPSLHNAGDLTDLLYGGSGSSRKGMSEGESRGGSEGPAVPVTGKGRDGGEEVRQGYDSAGRLRGADHSAQQPLHPQQGAAPYGGDRGIFSHRATLLDSYGRYGSPSDGSYSNTEDVQGYAGRSRASGYYDYSANRPPSSSGYAAAPYLGGEYDPRSGYRRGDALEPPLNPAPHYPPRGQPSAMRQWGEPGHLSPLQASAPQQPMSQLQQQQQHNFQLLPYQQQPLGNYMHPMQLPQMQHLPQMPDAQLQLQRQQLIPIADQMASGGGREVGYGLSDAKHQEELSLLGGRLSSDVNQPLAARPAGNRAYSAPDLLKKTASLNQTSTANTTTTTTVPSLVTSDAGSTAVPNSTLSSTTPASTTTSDTFSILGAWGSIVAKWKLDPAEIEAEKNENRLQHSGAVVALSLGLTVSAMLLLLLGCRVRGLRRRRHRGGRSSYAHDADYLVNGMYL